VEPQKAAQMMSNTNWLSIMVEINLQVDGEAVTNDDDDEKGALVQ